MIYNASFEKEYSPIDFSGSSAWKAIKTAASTGSLDEPFQTIYAPGARPMFEMYDLKEDPAELKNIFKNGKVKPIRDALLAKLVEWMVLERDYLPLPILK